MSTEVMCPTCRAMLSPGFTLETSHIAGMVIGILLAGGHTPAEARATAHWMLCKEHAADLVDVAQYLSLSGKKAHN